LNWNTNEAGLPTFIYSFSPCVLAYVAKNQSTQL